MKPSPRYGPQLAALALALVSHACGSAIVRSPDGDHVDDVVVVLTYKPGATPTFSFLAVVTRTRGILGNVATIALEDRVQIRSVRIEAGKAARERRASWHRLRAVAAATTERLSLATLAGTVWVLRAWDLTEASGLEPIVTLAYDADRLGARAATTVTPPRWPAGLPRRGEGRAAGGHAYGLCGPAVGGRGTVPRTTRRSAYGRFVLTRLAISYVRSNGATGVMLFDASTRRTE